MILAKKEQRKKRFYLHTFKDSTPNWWASELSGWARSKFFGNLSYDDEVIDSSRHTQTQTHGRQHSSAANTRRSKSPDLLRRPVLIPLHYISSCERIDDIAQLWPHQSDQTSTCTNHHILSSSSSSSSINRSPAKSIDASKRKFLDLEY